MCVYIGDRSDVKGVVGRIQELLFECHLLEIATGQLFVGVMCCETICFELTY